MNGKGTGATGYAAIAGTLAVLSLAAVWLLVPGDWPTVGPWLALGWGLMALTHVLGGSWMVARHGSPGSAFIVALGTSMLTRLFAAAAGGAAAYFSGERAAVAYVVGLVAGFVPLQILEIGWFLKMTRRAVADPAPNR